MLNGGTERTEERHVDWRNRATGEWDVEWWNRTDCRVEYLLEVQSGQESGMITRRTELTGDRNFN